jgi:hypothetical protein
MTRRFLAASTFSMVLAAALLAHEGGEHITGIVLSLSASSITVETATHEKKIVMLTPKTGALMSGKKAAVTDLKPGERVVVHAMKNKDGKLEAEEVQFGAPAPAAPHAEHQH